MSEKFSVRQRKSNSRKLNKVIALKSHKEEEKLNK